MCTEATASLSIPGSTILAISLNTSECTADGTSEILIRPFSIMNFLLYCQK